MVQIAGCAVIVDGVWRISIAVALIVAGVFVLLIGESIDRDLAPSASDGGSE